MSLLNTGRGNVTTDLLQELEKRLKRLMDVWIHLDLSFTPKFHILLNHSAEFLKRTGGFADMGEDHCERAHQERAWNQQRLICLHDKEKIMESQAKFQAVGLVDKVREFQAKVALSRKRKMVRATSLAEEWGNASKIQRTALREAANELHNILNETGEFATKVEKHRDKMKTNLTEAFNLNKNIGTL